MGDTIPSQPVTADNLLQRRADHAMEVHNWTVATLDNRGSHAWHSFNSPSVEHVQADSVSAPKQDLKSDDNSERATRMLHDVNALGDGGKKFYSFLN